ncbi:MAG: hypothetical protein MJ252_08820, partial [archaeon]|nr:hypothetical protein [archaeon]
MKSIFYFCLVLCLFEEFFLMSIKLKTKVKSKSERCSDYLPPVTYPDMTRQVTYGDEYYQTFVTPVQNSGFNRFKSVSPEEYLLRSKKFTFGLKGNMRRAKENNKIEENKAE